MERKKQHTEESSRKPIERNRESADYAARTQAQDPPATRPNLPAHLEAFAKAVAEGCSHVQAAEMCGLKRGSASFLYARPGVQERIAELQTLAKNATEKAVTENAIKAFRQIDIGRNDIIMGLVDCARDEKTEIGRLGVRVKAWLGLADIFMLRAKTIRDLSEFYGWIDDEIYEFRQNDTIPERFRRVLRPTDMGIAANEKASVQKKAEASHEDPKRSKETTRDTLM
jgi:hypothetical protein